MNRKVIIALAIILPLTGIGMLVAWAGSARQAAFDGAKLTPVVQIAKTVPAGTSTSSLGDYAQVVELPKSMVPEDAPAAIEDVKDGSVRYELAAGEIVTDAKIFSEDDGLEGAPEDYEEVTILLGPERGANQLVEVGDKVAIYSSFTNPEERTVRVLSNVLVSRIAGKSKVGEKASTEEAAGDLLVTFAVDSEDAKKIIYSSEFGEMWLSLATPSSDSSDESADPATPAPDDVTADDLTEGEAGQ